MNATSTRTGGIALCLALAGAAIGVVDGLAARWAAPGWSLAAPAVGALIDGALLGLAGLAWDRWRGRERARWQPRDARSWVAVAALATGASASHSEVLFRPPARAPPRPTSVDAPCACRRRA